MYVCVNICKCYIYVLRYTIANVSLHYIYYSTHIYIYIQVYIFHLYHLFFFLSLTFNQLVYYITMLKL